MQQKGPGENAGALLHGVSDGTRTRDHRHHKPVLYQLSYAHHAPAVLDRERGEV